MAAKSSSQAASKLNRSQAIRDYLAESPKSTPKEIQEALRKRGIEVSLGLANLIRYTKPKKGRPMAKKGKPGRPPAAAGKATRGGRSMNKSDAVREYLAQNPSASPVAVQQALKARGIVISASLASAIKYSKRGPGRPRGRRPGRPPGRPRAMGTAGSNGQIRADDLIAAKRFAEQVGGIATARKALDLLERLG